MDKADRLIGEAGFSSRVIESAPFRIFAAYPPGPAVLDGQVLTVVIEGDGFAWVDRHTVSGNPTPKDPVGLRIAAALSSSAVYLARPCQYVTQAICHQEYWSNRRFDYQIMSSYGQALDVLKQKYGNASFNLVGFSGGAYVALVLAAERDDILQVDTVGGLLDPLRWTTYHKISPLEDLPYNFSALLSRTGAVVFNHWCSDDDKVVPCALQYEAQAKAAAMGIQNHNVREVRGGHGSLWREYVTAVAN